MNGEDFLMYRGQVLKSRDGIPAPIPPPPGVDLAKEARTARSRFYPVTLAYTAYALVVLTVGLGKDPWTTVLFVMAGVACWTLVEYLVHRYILHGRFPKGSSLPSRMLHRVFDPSHGDHHLRPWDGRHINGALDTIPFAAILALTSFLARMPTLPVFVATILQCYVVEEWIHYSVHFHHFRWRYFRYIRTHHLYHHSPRGRDVAFGLSSGIWDVRLGTSIPPEDRDRLRRPPGRLGRPRCEPSVHQSAPSPSTTTTVRADTELAHE